MVNKRLSILQWKTVSAEIANNTNNLPLALGSITSNYESMDLITPNRLKLGRNNDRSPVGCLEVTNNQSRLLESNTRIYNAWFEHWLLVHVPKLVPQPKWFKSDQDLKQGDIVLFRKHDSALSATYQYGNVDSVEIGREGMVRKAKITSRHHNENINRETYRAVRELTIIHHVDELNIVQELGVIASFPDYKMRLQLENKDN